jgi:signal transduction histidine kinase
VLTFVSLTLLYTYESAYYMKPLIYRMKLALLAFVLLLFSFLLLQMDFQELVSYIPISILLVIALIALNNHYFTKLNQSHLYEELLAEYRKVKRQALINEKSVRIEERARIAREMHDSVGHKLTALSMQIEMLLLKEENEMLRSMKAMVNESLEETRKAVRALTIDDIEGISSVIQLIRKLESETQLRIHFTTKQGALSLPLSNQSSVVLYRVLQESLTNAMKYSAAREVYVELGVSPIGQLSLQIKNKFHSEKTIHEGFGLKNMRERVEELGGRLHQYQIDGFFIIEGILPVEEDSYDSSVNR